MARPFRNVINVAVHFLMKYIIDQFKPIVSNPPVKSRYSLISQFELEIGIDENVH